MIKYCFYEPSRNLSLRYKKTMVILSLSMFKEDTILASTNEPLNPTTGCLTLGASKSQLNDKIIHATTRVDLIRL